MDADGAFRAKRLEHVHRFFRADMVAAHQLARAEGTDCDQRQPWPPPLGGFSHPASIAPAGVAGEEQIAARKRDSESGPDRPVAVAHPTPPPMMAASATNLHTGLARHPPATAPTPHK